VATLTKACRDCGAAGERYRGNPTYCKACFDERARHYRLAKRKQDSTPEQRVGWLLNACERERENARLYRIKNRDRIHQRARKYRATERGQRLKRENDNRFHARHRERMREKSRAYSASERGRKYRKDYYAKNRLRILAMHKIKCQVRALHRPPKVKKPKRNFYREGAIALQILQQLGLDI
jgi:hypothetical protein